MKEQVTGVYANPARTLARFVATLNDVVKETVYTTDMAALAAATGARKKAYGRQPVGRVLPRIRPHDAVAQQLLRR